MNLLAFFANHPILTLQEFNAFLDQNYTENRRSRESLLSYHLREGHLLQVRRGLYAVVPPGMDPDHCPVDPYLVASKLTEDAVLAYHTALEVWGNAHSVFERYTIQSQRQRRPTEFRNHRFECHLFPKPLRDQHEEFFGTVLQERQGVSFRVTTLERTLVDILDRPKLGGGWEEIWQSFESVSYFDLDLLVTYALLLQNRTTAAKVGYYLEQHAESLMVETRHLGSLLDLRPLQPHYMMRGKKGSFVKKWNLIVPQTLLERNWQAVE